MPVTDIVHSGNVWAAFLFCFVRFFACKWCQSAQFGSIWVHLGPAVRNQKLAVSRARRTESRFRGHVFRMQAPTFGGFHPKRTAGRGFRPLGARLAAFWALLGRACPPKMGPRWISEISEKCCFSKVILDHLGCLLVCFYPFFRRRRRLFRTLH